MKKCKNCGALQSDDKTTCLDCGTLLGRPMTEEEEEAAEEQQAVEDTAYFQARQRIAEILSVLSEEDAKLLSLRFFMVK